MNARERFCEDGSAGVKFLRGGPALVLVLCLFCPWAFPQQIAYVTNVSVSPSSVTWGGPPAQLTVQIYRSPDVAAWDVIVASGGYVPGTENSNDYLSCSGQACYGFWGLDFPPGVTTVTVNLYAVGTASVETETLNLHATFFGQTSYWLESLMNVDPGMSTSVTIQPVTMTAAVSPSYAYSTNTELTVTIRNSVGGLITPALLSTLWQTAQLSSTCNMFPVPGFVGFVSYLNNPAWDYSNPNVSFQYKIEYTSGVVQTCSLRVNQPLYDHWLSASTSFTSGPTAPLNVADLGPSPQCQAKVGYPLNVTNGNVWIQQRDYSVPGLGGGLYLARTWNSLLGSAGPPNLAGMFGQSWRSTYEEVLSGPDSNNNLMYWRGDGSAWTFAYNSALNSYSLTSPPDARAQLFLNPVTGGLTLTLADGTQKVFNSQNLLAVIIDRNNNQTTLAYDSLNRLTSVTSPVGSTLSFTYGDPNNALQATLAYDAVGTVATYTYDTFSRLTQVSYPDGSALNFTYDPNCSVILSVTDSQGKLIESHTYDAQQRGLTSSRAYGVDSVTLTY